MSGFFVWPSEISQNTTTILRMAGRLTDQNFPKRIIHVHSVLVVCWYPPPMTHFTPWPDLKIGTPRRAGPA
jgi:hypothetical protein